MLLVLGVVGVDIECCSPVPSLLLHSLLLATSMGSLVDNSVADEFSVGSALSRLCWMASYFFWRRCSVARHKSHGASFFYLHILYGTVNLSHNLYMH